jgi:hypothetical protein
MTTSGKNRPMEKESAAPQEDLCAARPEEIPAPTAWPMVLALAATIASWGILTSWVFVVVGLVLSALCLYQWIEEMRS